MLDAQRSHHAVAQAWLPSYTELLGNEYLRREMDDLLRLVGRFIERDIIYFAGGLLIICAVGYSDASSWLGVQEVIKFLRGAPAGIWYAIILGFAYILSYLSFEIVCIIGLTVNHEWWYPRKKGWFGWFGRFISWVHYRIHGVRLLAPEPNRTWPDAVALTGLFGQPHERTNDIVEWLVNVGDKGKLGPVLYPYFIWHSDAVEEKAYWISRLTWLRFFASISGSCLLVAGVILAIAAGIWIGMSVILIGLFLALHAYYRSAQITLARLVIMSRSAQAPEMDVRPSP